MFFMPLMYHKSAYKTRVTRIHHFLMVNPGVLLSVGCQVNGGEYKIRPYKGFQDLGRGSAKILCSPDILGQIELPITTRITRITRITLSLAIVVKLV